MNIHFLTSRLAYPPDRGDRLRTLNLLKHLSTEYDITLVSFFGHETEWMYVDALS